MDSLDAPPNYAPPPPPKKAVRPKITLQIPESTLPTTPRMSPSVASMYWGSTKYRGRPPTTPISHGTDPNSNPYFNPFMHMYHNKASEFMFKRFEGFKDFTMETAKSGLSAGEKSAFWFVNKLKMLSKKWFTHFFLTLCLVLYSLMGAAVFLALEGYKEYDICTGRRAEKIFTWRDIAATVLVYTMFCFSRCIPLTVYLALGLVYIVVQIGICIIFCSG